MKSLNKFTFYFAGFVLLSGAASATVSINSAAPSVDGADQASLTWVGTSREKVFEDAPGGVSRNIGQAFTTGSNAGGYQISGWSALFDSDSNAPQDMTFNMRVVEISGDNVTTNTLFLESGLSITGGEWVTGDWMTWNFSSPVTLAADTLYGIDIEMTAAGAWQNGIPYFAYNNSDEFTGGYRYNLADGDPSSISSFTNTDRVFHVDMVAIPEPSSFAMLAACFGLAWVMVRRRS